MSYVTESTIWPDSVALDSSVKDVIALFYKLADNTGPEAGPRMAKEVFTETAKLVAGHGGFEGSEGQEILGPCSFSWKTYLTWLHLLTALEAISHSRDHAWDKIAGRRHNIFKVFVNDKEGHDLFLLGKVRMDLRNGKNVDSDFTAHILVDAESHASGSPRISLMQVFAVSYHIFINLLYGAVFS